MKIIVMSDTHLGFASGTEREGDSFLTFEEGIEKGREADLIILGGDIFDTRIPTTETFARAMETLLKANSFENRVRVLEGINKKIGEVKGVPIVSINGNHERRVKGLVNSVQALEKGGFLIHLHCNGVVFERNGEKVAVQGMSAVPEQYAPSVLEEWNPKPVPGCYNILLFHQNLEGFLYSETQLPKSAIPSGFDLYVCGDIHESHKAELHGSPLMLPGSTVTTQVKKEATEPRKYVLVDTNEKTQEFIAFENQRKIYYKTFEKREEAKSFIREAMKQEHSLKPVIKIKASFPPGDVKPLAEGEVLLFISEEKELPSVSIEEQKLSVQKSGRELLEKNLKEAKLDPKMFADIFDLLLEKKHGEVLSLLREETKDKVEA